MWRKAGEGGRAEVRKKAMPKMTKEEKNIKERKK